MIICHTKTRLGASKSETHEHGQQQTEYRAHQTQNGHGPPVEQVAQTVAGHDADQTGHVDDAGHSAAEPGLADLPDVRVRRAVVEAQAQAHRQRGHVQHGHRVGLPQQYPADYAGPAGHEHARLLAVSLLRVARQEAPDRLAQEQYAACEKPLTGNRKLFARGGVEADNFLRREICFSAEILL